MQQPDASKRHPVALGVASTKYREAPDPAKTAESIKSRIIRYGVNLSPVFRSTGAWITHISADMRLVRLKLPLTLKTRNPLGTMCGGNMYSAVHGIYLVMLMKHLGDGYACVDRLSTIHFLKPGRGTLYAEFRLDQEEVDAVRALVAEHGKAERRYLVVLRDADGGICGEVTNAIHIRRQCDRNPGLIERESRHRQQT